MQSGIRGGAGFRPGFDFFPLAGFIAPAAPDDEPFSRGDRSESERLAGESAFALVIEADYFGPCPGESLGIEIISAVASGWNRRGKGDYLINRGGFRGDSRAVFFQSDRSGRLSRGPSGIDLAGGEQKPQRGGECRGAQHAEGWLKHSCGRL